MKTHDLTTAQLITLTGYMACEIGEIHKTLDNLTEQALMTHQLSDAARWAGIYIQQQMPWVKDLRPPEISESVTNDVRKRVAHIHVHGVSLVYGQTHKLALPEPGEPGGWKYMHPLDGIAKAMGVEVVGR